LLEDLKSRKISDIQEHLARKIMREDGALQLARGGVRGGATRCVIARVPATRSQPAVRSIDGRCGTMGATAQGAEAYGELLSGPGPELVRLGRQVAEQTQQRELCDA